MELNKNLKQISLHNLAEDYNALKGKVVDKVAFNNKGDMDDQMFVIMFTDGTFINLGVDYRDSEVCDQVEIGNQWVSGMSPANVNGGNYDCHCYVREDGTVKFDRWIEILRDLGIWKITDEETLAIIERDKKKREEREYNEYLRLKEKYEGKRND